MRFSFNKLKSAALYTKQETEFTNTLQRHFWSMGNVGVCDRLTKIGLSFVVFFYAFLGYKDISIQDIHLV